MKNSVRTACLTVVALSVATWASAADQIGKELYLENCASCHGADGKGAGDIAKYMNVAPTDLTGLAAGNDGEFPFLSVMQIVDGRSGARGHGTEMPVWGDAFMSQQDPMPGDYSGVLEVRGRILSLVNYLEALQE